MRAVPLFVDSGDFFVAEELLLEGEALMNLLDPLLQHDHVHVLLVCSLPTHSREPHVEMLPKVLGLVLAPIRTLLLYPLGPVKVA